VSPELPGTPNVPGIPNKRLTRNLCSLLIGNTEVRLFGVDAFELAQCCGPLPCGGFAGRALYRLAGLKDVRCELRARGKTG